MKFDRLVESVITEKVEEDYTKYIKDTDKKKIVSIVNKINDVITDHAKKDDKHAKKIVNNTRLLIDSLRYIATEKKINTDDYRFEILWLALLGGPDMKSSGKLTSELRKLALPLVKDSNFKYGIQQIISAAIRNTQGRLF